MEKAPSSEVINDEYGWTEEELKMPLVFQGQYLDYFPSDDSNRSVKVAARWNGRTKTITVKAVDGFSYIIKGVERNPGPEESLVIHDQAQNLWREWYMEQLKNPENNPNNSTKH